MLYLLKTQRFFGTAEEVMIKILKISLHGTRTKFSTSI